MVKRVFWLFLWRATDRGREKAVPAQGPMRRTLPVNSRAALGRGFLFVLTLHIFDLDDKISLWGLGRYASKRPFTPDRLAQKSFFRTAGMAAFHLWTPRSRQGKTSGLQWRVVGCCHLSGLQCGRTIAAGLYGSSRTRSRSPEACSKHCGKPWLSQPRLADCCAILSFRSPLRRRDRIQPTPPRPELCRCRP
jgi:hypothetical protein